MSRKTLCIKSSNIASKNIETNITSVLDDYTFTVEENITQQQMFVYGREVDDFHVVDYDALSILHISATQELYKIIKKLQENIANLEIQLIASS